MMRKIATRAIVFSIFALLAVGAISSALPADANSGIGGISQMPQKDFALVGTEDITKTVYLPLIMAPYKPLFVGLSLQWTGAGYGRGTTFDPWEAAHSLTRDLDIMTDSDTIRSRNYEMYTLNPFSWPDASWYAYYSVSSLQFRSSSAVPNPDWKWDYWDWILPRSAMLSNGATYMIGGQPFLVSGPFDGYSAFGQAVRYWRLANQNAFLLWDDGGVWTLYAHPGEIILHYEAGERRLLLYYDELRHYYKQGNLVDDTVRWLGNLTATNAWPGSLRRYQDSGLFPSIAPHLQPETTDPDRHAITGPREPVTWPDASRNPR